MILIYSKTNEFIDRVQAGLICAVASVFSLALPASSCFEQVNAKLDQLAVSIQEFEQQTKSDTIIEAKVVNFSSEGYRKLGRNYAETMLSVLAGQKPDEPEEEPIGPTDPKDLFKIEEGKFIKLSGSDGQTIDYQNKSINAAGGYGATGWKFTSPVNLKGQGYLVAKFSQVDDKGKPALVINNTGNIYDEAYQEKKNNGQKGEFYYSVIDLSKDFEPNEGTITTGLISLDKLSIIGIQVGEGPVNYTIENVYVTDKNPLEEGEGEVPSEPTPVEDLFKLDASSFKKMSGHEITTVEFKESKAIVKNAGSYGVVGWDFSTSPVNLEGKGYLVVELSEYITELPWIVICDKGLYGEGYKTEKATEKEGKYYVVLSLDSDPTSNISPNDGTEKDNSIDLSNLTYVGLQSGTSENELPNGGYTVDKVYFSSTNPLKQ